MESFSFEWSPRILVVDDNPSIHDDLRKVLLPDEDRDEELELLEAELFGGEVSALPVSLQLTPEIDSAIQGAEAIQKLQRSVQEKRPYFLAFIDVRMPPGMDGVQTIKELWKHHPGLYVVICSAYSDYNWEAIHRELGCSPNLLILRKPFEAIEALQIVSSMMEKYKLRLMTERALLELSKAKRKAERASSAKSDFLADVNHELRTPLSSIMGYAELLSAKELSLEPEVRSGYLERILLASNRLLRLSDELLDLAKIEAGKVELHIRDYSIKDLINEVLDTIEPLAERNNNTVKVELSDKIDRIQMDVTKLRQCLLNLLSNACKFSQNETILLKVDMAMNDGEEWLSFQVQDFGIGMTHEQMEGLFERFAQGSSDIAQKYGGTGLGLSISRSYCQLMGGRLNVLSEPNEGSTFTIELPRSIQHQSSKSLS